MRIIILILLWWFWSIRIVIPMISVCALIVSWRFVLTGDLPICIILGYTSLVSPFHFVLLSSSLYHLYLRYLSPFSSIISVSKSSSSRVPEFCWLLPFFCSRYKLEYPSHLNAVELATSVQVLERWPFMLSMTFHAILKLEHGAWVKLSLFWGGRCTSVS